MSLHHDALQYLRELDRILVSSDPTVRDAFKQAIVLSMVAEQDSVFTGPLEKMFWELTELRRDVESLKMAGARGSTYWTDSTYTSVKNSPNWGVTTATTGGLPSLSIEEIANLTNKLYSLPMTMPNDKTVMPASPTDADAFTMFDPDTGDSMSVKYK